MPREDRERRLRGRNSRYGSRSCGGGREQVHSRPSVQGDRFLIFSCTSRQRPVSEQEFDRAHADVTTEQLHRTTRAYFKTNSHEVDGEVVRMWRESESPPEADMGLMKQLHYLCPGPAVDGRMVPGLSSDSIEVGRNTLLERNSCTSRIFTGFSKTNLWSRRPIMRLLAQGSCRIVPLPGFWALSRWEELERLAFEAASSST